VMKPVSVPAPASDAAAPDAQGAPAQNAPAPVEKPQQ